MKASCRGCRSSSPAGSFQRSPFIKNPRKYGFKLRGTFLDIFWVRGVPSSLMVCLRSPVSGYGSRACPTDRSSTEERPRFDELEWQAMAHRLYYEDSFLTSFDARVTDIRLVSRTAEETVWQVALDQTAFYPASGGQPFDTGALVAESRTGAVLEVPVTAVDEDEHGEVWHTTTKP